MSNTDEALSAVTLDDKYELERGRVFLTGTQALVRLPLLQKQRDVNAGLNTAGFISGYRGSPLGGVDKELWRARKFLNSANIVFQPGVNEDLAATAVWGTQQVGLTPGAKFDGVFGMWYGKDPGVDRTGDVFRHANHAGTAPNGGVLVIAGDDPGAKSSTVATQSDYAFMDAQIPVLNPANVQDYIDLGIYGWALSRFSGCWVAMKTVAEGMESTSSVQIDPDRIKIVIPTDFEVPKGGLSIRWPDDRLMQDARLQHHKLYAALAFAKANKLDKVVIDAPEPRFGIMASGKAYLDVMQALEDLGIDDAHAAEIGLRVYKVGMSWPLERDGARAFAEGLEEILVVEEKRAVIENQLKEQLYNWREDVRPRVVGKFDESGKVLLSSAGELTPAQVGKVIAERIDQFYTSNRVKERLAFIAAKEESLNAPRTSVNRVPYFCSGCPHNTSTKVPEGSRAVAGIGCHFMAVWMNRSTATFTHMGGEGANWIGQAPFTETKHIFANLGDGTYYHSGLLAIRAAAAAGVNITYKILFNDAVAMTGGQPFDGPLDVPIITRQVAAEGVGRIAVVSDDPGKYPIGSDFAPGVTFHHRDDLDRVQRDLRDWQGISVLVYDQVCAAEKRRRRKRGQFPDPARRIFINEAVCEGCGDCGIASNCVSVAPLETEFGRKRTIDQSACNKDYSCVNGFCPSFVSVNGGTLRKKAGPTASETAFTTTLPDPSLPTITAPYGLLITGIGGTGVVTVGALIGMAAHLEGKGVSVLDMTGLAQKNGAVISHVRIANQPEDIHAVRIAAGAANAVIGCDIVTAGGFDALSKMNISHTRAVINDFETMTADFTANKDLVLPTAELREIIGNTCDDAAFIDATGLATRLMGDSIAANLFMVGFAWQKGLLPLSFKSIERAIELNGVAIDFNKQAFMWGRRAAVEPDAVAKAATPVSSAPEDRTISQTTGDRIARRAAFLTDYQDAAYAARYTALVERVNRAEQDKTPGLTGLSDAVAEGYFRLLSCKDEYEVARLYTHPDFRRAIREQFEGGYTLSFHLAPPMLADRDPETGHLKKKTYGGWMMGVFRILASLKGLRGTVFDPFGYTDERRMERRLVTEYETLIDEILAGLTPDNHATAIGIATLPMDMVGFGHVKERNVAKAKERETELLTAFRAGPAIKAAE
ncbi:MAG: indolepyruvate ferredoxin oxidoreductase family protein [Rhodospirillales bacterium]|nr:indolepyruvate ferredoxin oxidoreductase family protein [Rhodospirillales bacterium]